MCEASNWLEPYIMRLSGIVKNLKMSILGIHLSGCFLVSGFINYPGHKKINLLKELEIIANTIYQGEIL